eukprot:GGOE01000608.1.p1 GENE.GGOE01000608.1~~GGOE01000608.1.p1  ORF type:complete len:512 (-),score=57.91 GGOE01000608.1:439-1974(-)
MVGPYNGRILNVEYREVTPGENQTSLISVPTTATPQQPQGQVQVHPFFKDVPTGPEHYPTSDGFASPYEGLRSHINRNPFFKSYYDLPADLRTASNPPGDFVVLESQPELRYMLTGPPAQEPIVGNVYGQCFNFQKCRMKITAIRSDDPADDEGPAVHLSELLLFDEQDQVIDTGLAVALCSSFGQCEDGEGAQQVLDGNPYTKFLRKDCDFPVDLEVDLGIRYKVRSYAWRTADGSPSRDPISWNFQVFTRHGWATLDQVTLHCVPEKRHTLVGPFRLMSPYDPTVHVDIRDPPSLRAPTTPLAIAMKPHSNGGPSSRTMPSSRSLPSGPSAELHELVHSAYPQEEGWDAYHKLVERLLAAHADPNHSDAQGRSTLLKACLEGDGYVIHRLIQCGANTNKQASTGESALHRLTLNGDHRNLKLVLDEGANPNLPDSQGDTPLHLAVARMDLAATKLLLQRGAVKTLPNSKGQQPIDVWEEEMRVGAARAHPAAAAVRTTLLGQVRTSVDF